MFEPICWDCKHFSQRKGCRAFPIERSTGYWEIPYEITSINEHSTPLKWQRTNLVFEQRKNYKHPVDWED